MDIREQEFKIKKGNRTLEVYWPCKYCYSRDTCENHKGCFRWKAWFRVIWAELRRQYA